MEEAGEESRADSFTGHIGDDGGELVFGEFDDVEVVAADLVGGVAGASHLQPAVVGEGSGQEALLDAAGEREFFLHFAFVAFVVEESGVFEDGGGFDGECLEEFAITSGEVDGPGSGIHVEDAFGVAGEVDSLGVADAAEIDADEG